MNAETVRWLEAEVTALRLVIADAHNLLTQVPQSYRVSQVITAQWELGKALMAKQAQGESLHFDHCTALYTGCCSCGQNEATMDPQQRPDYPPSHEQRTAQYDGSDDDRS